MVDDPIFRAFIPQGLEVLLAFFERSKDIVRLFKKYGEEVRTLTALAESNGMTTILSTQIDSYGEFIHEPFIERIRAITQEEMTQARRDNHSLGDRDEYWLKELASRSERGELNL